MAKADKATPPPEPNFNAALPRRLTYFGRRSADLISLLLSKVAKEDVLREMDSLDTFLDTRLEEWDESGRWEQFFYKEAEEGQGALERARARIAAGDRHGALAEIEAASFTRREAHVQKAYDLAMEAAGV